MDEQVTAVVLAAGAGTRMRSTTPKVLHPLGGETMLAHVLRATRQLSPASTLVVVGHGRDQVTAALPADAAAVVQDRQGGTGHAVRTALDAHPAEGIVVVVPGDAPLLRGETLAALVDYHRRRGGSATVMTARMTDPTGYGRVVRDSDGGVGAIVEERDADDTQRAIDEVAVSVYAFAAGPLRAALTKLTTNNAQGQEYLTDVVGLLRAEGHGVVAAVIRDAGEVQGVNDRIQLATAARMLRDRLVRQAMLAGVTIVDPETTWLDADVSFEPDAVIEPNTQLRGRTHLAAGCVVGPNATLTDTSVGSGAVITASTCTSATVGAGATVGPYAHLRPGTVLGVHAKAGAFVETKAADIGDGAKVPHLAYVGDATVGARSNIGCGTVFVNYDGVRKSRTAVGADVRIGANNSLIAPLAVGDGAYTGADAVIRHDVAAGALAYSSNEQVTREGWVAHNRDAQTASPPEADPATTRDEGPPSA